MKDFPTGVDGFLSKTTLFLITFNVIISLLVTTRRQPAGWIHERRAKRRRRLQNVSAVYDRSQQRAALIHMNILLIQFHYFITSSSISNLTFSEMENLSDRFHCWSFYLERVSVPLSPISPRVHRAAQSAEGLLHPHSAVQRPSRFRLQHRWRKSTPRVSSGVQRHTWRTAGP